MTTCVPDLISEIYSLGSFPAVYQQLDDALNDENSSINRFSEIIQHESATGTPRPRGRILVLEDDEALQKLLATMIQRLGYRADLVSRGEDVLGAFQAAERGGEPFDGAVLDLIVPGGMGGCEVIQQLRALRPGFPALVSSGAANNPAIAEFQQHGFCGAIAKPYTLEQFAEALGKLLPAERA